jgi:hypothetical protein
MDPIGCFRNIAYATQKAIETGIVGLDQPEPTLSSQRITRAHVARHNGLDQPDPTFSLFESGNQEDNPIIIVSIFSLQRLEPGGGALANMLFL